MDANREKGLVARLKEELKKRKVSVRKFEGQTGIPQDRVYKWLKRTTGKIDHADAVIVENWLSGNLDNIPNDLNGCIYNLTESSQTISEAYLLNQKNIGRLITLLENQASE